MAPLPSCTIKDERLSALRRLPLSKSTVHPGTPLGPRLGDIAAVMSVGLEYPSTVRSTLPHRTRRMSAHAQLRTFSGSRRLPQSGHSFSLLAFRGAKDANTMVRLIIAGVLLSSCSAVLGWKAQSFRDAQSCKYMAGNIPTYAGYISRLPAMEGDIPPVVIAEIYRCWAAYPAQTMMRQLKIEDARQLTASTYLLAFGIWGVSDRSLLLEVDKSGQVRRAYQYPYTL